MVENRPLQTILTHVTLIVDGESPIRFFLDVLLALSRTNNAAFCVILFIYGGNQYLWPCRFSLTNN